LRNSNYKGNNKYDSEYSTLAIITFSFIYSWLINFNTLGWTCLTLLPLSLFSFFNSLQLFCCKTFSQLWWLTYYRLIFRLFCWILILSLWNERIRLLLKILILSNLIQANFLHWLINIERILLCVLNLFIKIKFLRSCHFFESNNFYRSLLV